MSEQTKKKKVKINVIDVLIILLVIVLIATVVYRVYTGINDKTSSSKSRYVITFECNDVYDSLAKYLTDGKAVYLESNGTLLGHIHRNDDAALTVFGESVGKGAYSMVSLRGYIKMSSEAVKSSSAGYYSIGDINVTVGSCIEVYTNETSFTLTVKSIDAK